MRTSNKILLGAFLAVIVMIFAVHFSLYAKFSGADFISRKRETEAGTSKQAFAGIRELRITGLEDLEFRFSDTLQVETDKDHSSRLKIILDQNVLTIKGDTTVKQGSESRRIRSGEKVVVFLPSSVRADIDLCNVFFAGSEDSAVSGSAVFNVSESRIVFGFEEHEEMRFLDSLSLNASKDSRIEMSSVKIRDLKVSLNRSSLEEKSARIDKLAITVDDSSAVRLSGANMRKLNLNPAN
jgi:hypothetical protein